MAFDMKEPWATHRKYEVFEDKYPDIFGRPAVTADRIVLCQIIMDAISDAIPKIENQAFAKYVLTRYMLLYFFREVLEGDPLGPALLSGPEAFVRTKENRARFKKCADRIVSDIVVDLNLEVKGIGDSFDYRDTLRDSETVKGWNATITKDRLKLINRGSIPSFHDEWLAGSNGK